jgi:hypothetical protein
VLLKREADADSFAAKFYGREADECRDIENITVGQPNLPLPLRHEVEGFAVVFALPLHLRRVQPVKLKRAIIRSANHLSVASAVKKGVNGEVNAKLSSASPIVRPAVGDLMAGVILGSFLAVTGFPIKLARK